jgi:hypothetical protein
MREFNMTYTQVAEAITRLRKALADAQEADAKTMAYLAQAKSTTDLRRYDIEGILTQGAKLELLQEAETELDEVEDADDAFRAVRRIHSRAMRFFLHNDLGDRNKARIAANQKILGIIENA